MSEKRNEPKPGKRKPKLTAKQELDRELRRRQRKLQFIVTREEFLLVWPVLQSASKNLAAVAGLIFAGSLTFLGLSGDTPFEDLVSLKLSWSALAVSVVAHIFVYIAGLDSHINHARTETHSNNSKTFFELKDGDLLIEGLREGIRAHWYQAVFFKSNMYIVIALVFQVISLILGGALMASFITGSV